MDLTNPARTAVRQCVGLEEDESVVIVTDSERRDIANALYKEALKITNDTILISYQVGNQHGEEPPA